MKNFILFSVVLLFIFGCEKEESTLDAHFNLDETFTLKFGEEATCSCGNLEVQFSDVIEDSRCPQNVECVWEGQVSVQISILDENNSELQTLELTKHLDDIAPATDTLGNYIYFLKEVLPYPLEPMNIEENDYEIELIVTEL